jgi:uncharacterized protein
VLRIPDNLATIDHELVNRWRTALRIAAGIGAGTAAAGAGISWWYARVLLDTRRRRIYPDRVLRADTRTVTLAMSRLTRQPGVWGVRWAEGLAEVGPVIRADDHEVVRPLISGPVPPVGPVVVDAGPYDPDPAARGLAFEHVAIPAPLGPCPAWVVPPLDGDASGADWVVMVHGKGGSRREALRVLPTLHELGLAALVVTYRNDVDEGAPPSPDRLDHLGDTEWFDAEAAVAYAVGHGAGRVVLFGWSMGGAITGQLLDRSPLAEHVVAVVWDAPLVDWRATLRRQARNRGLPTQLIGLVTAAAHRRIGIDFDRFDLRAHPPRRRPPTLVVHSSDDTAVPASSSRDLAAAASRLGWPMEYVEVAAVEHTASWNADPRAYEQVVTKFLSEALVRQP